MASGPPANPTVSRVRESIKLDTSELERQLNEKTGIKHNSKHRHKHKEKDKDTVTQAPPIDPRSAARHMINNEGLSNRRLQASGMAAAYHLGTVLQLLEKRAELGKASVTEEELEKEIGVQIRSIPNLLKTLRSNPHILYEDGFYSWRGSLDTLIGDVNQLIEVLRQVRFVKGSDLKGSYKGYERDLKRLKEEGVIGEFASDTPKEKLYFYYDPELISKRASEYFRKEWADTVVPTGIQEREEILRGFNVQPLTMVSPFEKTEREVDLPPKRKSRAPRNWFNEQLLKEEKDE